MAQCCQASHGQGRLNPFSDRQSQVAGAESDFLLHRVAHQLVQWVLKQEPHSSPQGQTAELFMPGDPPPARAQESGQNLGQRALPGTVVAYQGCELSWVEGQVQILQNRPVPVASLQTLDGNQGGGIGRWGGGLQTADCRLQISEAPGVAQPQGDQPFLVGKDVLWPPVGHDAPAPHQQYAISQWGDGVQAVFDDQDG